MNSRLLLSQDRLPDPTARRSLDGPAYDGILTAGEVLGTWKLKAELVTLSACRSGLGRPSGGEGYVGFAQAFFLAGARSLVVSLWAVDDRATSLLMTRFYQNWLGKRPGLDRPLSKADALREAKAWLRHLSGSEVDRELESIARGGLRPRSSRAGGGPPLRPSPRLGRIHPPGRPRLNRPRGYSGTIRLHGPKPPDDGMLCMLRPVKFRNDFLY